MGCSKLFPTFGKKRRLAEANECFEQSFLAIWILAEVCIGNIRHYRIFCPSAYVTTYCAAKEAECLIVNKVVTSLCFYARAVLE